jgi:hypothetical protein
VTHISHIINKSCGEYEIFGFLLPTSAVVPSSECHGVNRRNHNTHRLYHHTFYQYSDLLIVYCPQYYVIYHFCRFEWCISLERGGLKRSIMTSIILQVSRTGRRLAVQLERLYGGKVKITYNIQQIASMVSEQ